MAKNIFLKKGKDKLLICAPDGVLMVDVIIAKSSRNTSINLSFQTARGYDDTIITKVAQSTPLASQKHYRNRTSKNRKTR